MKTLIRALAVTAALAPTAGFAASWTLNNDGSQLAFASVKKDTIGEVHHFQNLSGTVSEEGTATIEIDLASVQTNIDIRNERMVEHVFKNAPTATINVEIADMDDVKALAVGQTMETYAEGTLDFIGTEVPLDADLFVARLSETQVLVTTSNMIFVETEAAGITAGIDKLMELASLPGITRTAPVTLRFMFDAPKKAY